MAFKMKESPAKRGAIMGVGPNADSPMQFGLIGKGLKLGYKYAKKLVGSSSKTAKKTTTKKKTTPKKTNDGFRTWKTKDGTTIIEVEGTPGNYTIATTRTQRYSGDLDKILAEANAASKTK
jgi:hypothetical protein